MEQIKEIELQFQIIRELEEIVKKYDNDDDIDFLTWVFGKNAHIENKIDNYKKLIRAYRNYTVLCFDGLNYNITEKIKENDRNIKDYLTKFNLLRDDYNKKYRGCGMVVSSLHNIIEEQINELDFLKNENETLQKTVEKLNKKNMVNENSIEKMKVELNLFESDISVKEIELYNITSKLNEHIKLNKEQSNNLKIYQEKYNELIREIEKQFADKQLLNENINELVEKNNLNENTMSKQIEQIENLTNELSQKTENEKLLQNEIDGLREKEKKYLSIINTYISKISQQKIELEKFKSL